MIYTSSHNSFEPIEPVKTYAISGDKGASAGYTGRCYMPLAPKMSFWREWKSNIGKVPKLENNFFYIREYWKQVLSQLDPETVYTELDGSVLLCYEPGCEFCHRHIVAGWFNLLLKKQIPEIALNRLDVQFIQRPSYIEAYLELFIKRGRNMRGFRSLRALYLFEQAEELEERANSLDRFFNCSHDGMRQKACFLRCEAEMAEVEYNKTH